MKSITCLSGVSFFVLLSAATFTHARVLPEVKELHGQQFQQSHLKSPSMKVIESFYRKNIQLNEVINVATGRVLSDKVPAPLVSAEKISPSTAIPVQSSYVYLAEELDTLRIPGAIFVVFSRDSDKTEARKIGEKFDEKCEKYKLGEEDPDLPRSAAIKRSNFITEIENEWGQVKLQVQKPQRRRPQLRDLANELKKAQDREAELKKDKSSVYDVVLKRENSTRTNITPFYYIGPEEVMPVEKHTQPNQKRKWSAIRDAWDRKNESENLRSYKKCKLDL